jgi:hypothetical protein
MKDKEETPAEPRSGCSNVPDLLDRNPLSVYTPVLSAIVYCTEVPLACTLLALHFIGMHFIGMRFIGTALPARLAQSDWGGRVVTRVILVLLSLCLYLLPANSYLHLFSFDSLRRWWR